MRAKKDAAYFAGLIDGDGCISRTANGAALISLGMADEPSVRAAHGYFVVGNFSSRPGRLSHNKRLYEWRATYRAARSAIRMIQPFLITKAEIASALVGPYVSRKISRIDRTAYFAGLFDAEGYVAIRTPKNRSPEPVLALGMNHEPTIRAIAEHFGVGSVMTQPAGWCGRKNAHYTWRASARAARTILIQMLPYLRVKAAAARHALDVPVMAIGHKPEGWKPATRQAHWKPLRRRRIYATNAERQRAFKARKKAWLATEAGGGA